jgi:membrane fusion protein, adhesin transport system
MSHPSIQNQSALSKLNTPRIVHRLGWLFLLLLLMSLLGLALIPWQQTVVGLGKITVLNPSDRPQTIEAQLSGRIKTWFVKEGALVQKGQPLLALEDLDPKFTGLLSMSQITRQKSAVEQRRSAIENRISALTHQYRNLSTSREAAIPSSQERTGQASNRFIAAQQSVKAAQETERVASLNLLRLEALYQKGLRSRRDLEVSQQEALRAKTELERQGANLAIAQQDNTIAAYDVQRITSDTAAGLNAIESSLNAAYESLASTDNELRKLDIDLETLKQRLLQREIKAPRTGRLVRILKPGEGETVDAGDPLATIVPETPDQAVALYISDVDAPLLQRNRPVRLQFSGWPAIQFAGWPKASFGTFAGVIQTIDAVDEGSSSRYRILVTPDWKRITSQKETAWPTSSLLRPGTKTTGWVMLNVVPLGYELWRQFNGFQPNFPSNTDKEEEKEEKGPDIKRKKKK